MILGTFFTISDENITSTIGYISDFIGDLTPLMLPIIAVAVGIFIFWAIVKAVKS